MAAEDTVAVAVVVTAAGSVLASVFSAHALLNAVLLRRADPNSPAVPANKRISVLIPARNEAHRIGPTITSVLACDGVEGGFELIVLDDHSTDATSDVVRAAAAGDPRLRVITGKDLPPGWLGKPFACNQLGRLAAGDVLVFIDADVVLAPAALRATVALMERHNLHLVSPYPKQIMGSAAERLVQPLLQWLFLTFLPLRLAERPNPVSMAAANGQLLAVDAKAWRQVGGHESVCSDVIEDVALAASFKRNGFRAVVAEGSAIASCRMYDGWNELRDGYSKSLWAALPSKAASRGIGSLLLLAYVVPATGMLAGIALRRPRLFCTGALGYLAGVLGRVISAHATRGRKADALAHPASVLTLIGLGIRSNRLARQGKLSWKGRKISGERGAN